MYNYHADIIWGIDKILLGVTVLLAIFDILYVAFKEISESEATRKLAIIKRNLRDLARTGAEKVKNVCPVIMGKVTSQQFLEIARDKELTVSREFEKELRDCFMTSGRIGEIERVSQTSRNKWHRIQAIISLGYTNSPAAVEILKNSLVEKDEDVSYFSMLALGQLRDNSSAKILLDYLGSHRNSGNRIISLLDKFPSDIVSEALKATESGDPVVRFWAVKLISRFKSKSCLQRIEELTGDTSDDVRAAACECLGKIGSGEAKDTVVRCFSDKVWFVRMHAVRALSAILGKESIPEIVTLLKDKTWLVRDAVKKTMVHNIDAALPYLERLIHEGGDMLKKDCVEVLEDSGYLLILFKKLLSENAEAKNKAVNLLKEIMNSGAHLGLESALAGLGEETQKRILQIISDIDKALSEHIDKKIRHQIAET